MRNTLDACQRARTGSDAEDRVHAAAGRQAREPPPSTPSAIRYRRGPGAKHTAVHGLDPVKVSVRPAP